MALSSTSRMQRVEIGAMDGRTRQGPVWFEEMSQAIAAHFLQIRREIRDGRTECCALCRLPFQPGDFLTVSHCNHVFFPSCFLHTPCVDWMNLGDMARRLRDDWQNAQRYAHWF